MPYSLIEFLCRMLANLNSTFLHQSILAIKSDDDLHSFFRELGVSTMIHRKVIVSMIQKVLIGDYDMGGKG